MTTKTQLPQSVQNLRKVWQSKKLEMEFTQVTAAKDLGWSQGAISHYLNDVTELNPQAIIKFANFLDVDPREIDPNIECDLPSVTKIPVSFDASDMTKPLTKVNRLDRKPSSSIFVRLPDIPPYDKIFQIHNFPSYTKEILVKLVKPKDYPNTKAYAVKLKNKKKLHFYPPDSLPPSTDIQTLWSVVSVTLY